jgi:hypothetical protein
LIKVQRDRTDLTDLLIRCAQELHDKATYEVNRKFIIFLYRGVCFGYSCDPSSLYLTSYYYLLKTITSKVEEESHARQRLVRLQAKEKVLKNEVKNLEEKLGAEQRSFAHTTSQQV